MWQLAVPAPKHAAIAMLVGVSALAGVATRSAEQACPFEQTWYAGDVHFNERIEFRADASGTWISSGMADEARQERRTFRWSRTSSRLSVMAGDVRRDIGYSVRPYRQSCFLTFEDHPLLGDRSGFTHFSNRE